jgi:hypothetical protein
VDTLWSIGTEPEALAARGDAVILIVLPRLLDAIAAAGLRAVNLRSAILQSADPGSAIA